MASSSMPSTSTPPPCEPRYGRTRSSARSMRARGSSGWRPCSESRPATTGSAASASMRSAGCGARSLIDREHALDAFAVEGADVADELFSERCNLRAADRRDFVEQMLDRRAGVAHAAFGGRLYHRLSCERRRSRNNASLRRRPANDRARYFAKSCSTRPVGECSFFSSLPGPRYMWTPHGRHGSKLRTVRMMSMPLKLSGPFSSKIGVPCTASS